MKDEVILRNKKGGITIKVIEKPNPKPEPDFVREVLRRIAKKLRVDLSDLGLKPIHVEEAPVENGGSIIK